MKLPDDDPELSELMFKFMSMNVYEEEASRKPTVDDSTKNRLFLSSLLLLGKEIVRTIDDYMPTAISKLFSFPVP
jgi:hypothetical protein